MEPIPLQSAEGSPKQNWNLADRAGSWRPGPIRFFRYVRVVVCLVLLGGWMAALTLPSGVGAVGMRDGELPPPFQLASSGCPMAHCDPQMTDFVRASVPEPAVGLQWYDPVKGSDGRSFGSPGLGCSGNGSTVACSFGRLPVGYPTTPCDPALSDLVVTYGYAGTNGLPYRKWGSGDQLNCTSYTSAPMVSVDGGVIAADDQTIIRFGADGTTVWQTATPGGFPLSPVITRNGVIVLATSGGPISAYDNQTGALIGALDLLDGDGRYETINTPGVQGNRLYVLTHHSVRREWGRLVAIDVIVPPNYNPADPASIDPSQTLREVWSVEVGGPGGASPLVVGNMIFFDGDRREPGGVFAPHAFAVRDLGDRGEMAWVRAMPGRVQASFALDPRGGMWIYTMDDPAKPVNRFLLLVALADWNGDGQGDIIDFLDVDALVSETGVHRPYSAMTISGGPQRPIMLLSAAPLDLSQATERTFVVAVDLKQRSLLWKVPLPVRLAPAQFPIMEGERGPRVFFTAQGYGVWMIGKRP